MISLTINRDISIENNGTAFCYDIDFRADCVCGNQLIGQHSFNKQSVSYVCIKCDKVYSFTVTDAQLVEVIDE